MLTCLKDKHAFKHIEEVKATLSDKPLPCFHLLQNSRRSVAPRLRKNRRCAQGLHRLTRVQHTLHDTGRRVLTFKELAARQPTLVHRPSA